jgi:hypothetical protein
MEVGLKAVEDTVSLPSSALQLLPPASRARGAGARKDMNGEKTGEEIAKLHKIQLTWKTRHAGPLWIRSASFNARLSEAP